MASKYRKNFFDAKRPWSAYKDKVLDYYLRPYLEKVKMLGKPIVVVDMFAGRGEFKSGELGSPLIIAHRLQHLANQGVSVRLRCYENYKPFYQHLERVLKPFAFAEAKPRDCFGDVDELAALASTSTVLLYVDPCDVSQLSLSRLKLIYDKVRQNTSVEVLLVFMATAFIRQAAWAKKLTMQLADSGVLNDPLIREAEEDDKAMWLEALYGVENDWYSQSQETQRILDDVAGGDYWRPIIEDSTIDWNEKCFRLVDEYIVRLRSWFKVAEALPVHSDLMATIPKYWIVFASRYEPALDLFNLAACEVVRSQRQNFMQPGTLFADTGRQPDAASPALVDRSIKRAGRGAGSHRWNELRWIVCGGRSVGQFKESEVNQGIKRLLKGGWLSGATGTKVEDNAILSPTQKLDEWLDH